MTPTPRLEVGSTDFFIISLFAIGAYLQANGIQTYKLFYLAAWVSIVVGFLASGARKP